MLLKRIASADSRHARILLKASLGTFGSREQRRFNISGETPTAISIDNHVTCKRNIAEKSRESPSCNPSGTNFERENSFSNPCTWLCTAVDSEVGGRCHGGKWSEFYYASLKTFFRCLAESTADSERKSFSGNVDEFSLRDLSCCHLHRILSRCSDGETLNRLLTASLASRIKTRLKGS